MPFDVKVNAEGKKKFIETLSQNSWSGKLDWKTNWNPTINLTEDNSNTVGPRYPLSVINTKTVTPDWKTVPWADDRGTVN